MRGGHFTVYRSFVVFVIVVTSLLMYATWLYATEPTRSVCLVVQGAMLWLQISLLVRTP